VDQGPDEIRQVIEHTREDLADTIEALGQKADVKARIGGKAQATTEKVIDKAEEVVDKVQETVPDQVAPGVSAVTSTLREAGRRAADPKNRMPIIVGVAVIAVVVVVRRHLGRA
jgi:t-SNARE complex subunit (syntaxin)